MDGEERQDSKRKERAGRARRRAARIKVKPHSNPPPPQRRLHAEEGEVRSTVGTLLASDQLCQGGGVASQR